MTKGNNIKLSILLLLLLNLNFQPLFSNFNNKATVAISSLFKDEKHEIIFLIKTKLENENIELLCRSFNKKYGKDGYKIDLDQNSLHFICEKQFIEKMISEIKNILQEKSIEINNVLYKIYDNKQ